MTHATEALGRLESSRHSHVFLGSGHEQSERRTWVVIGLCGAMMILEIVGGSLFGSIALVADGMHMSTHAGALLLAALAYSFARRHADDGRFSFGTGKLGDLAGFTSAVVLAMIALLISYEAVSRLFAPAPIHFAEAIPIACLGLGVNIASAWLLSGGHHHHGHAHGQAGDEQAHEEEHRVETPDGVLVLSVFEDGVPPVFRLRLPESGSFDASSITIETIRPGGERRLFAMADRGGWLESLEAIPEPHAFTARLRIGDVERDITFAEHDHGPGHGASHRDNNMRAAIIHVLADAAVSVLVIIGLTLAWAFGWLWMDALAGIVGACVIASWSYGLIRDTGAILLDMVPDPAVAENIRRAVQAQGDRIDDLHLWRLGPGHLGAIVAIATAEEGRGPRHYRRLLAQFPTLSHVTIEVQRGAGNGGAAPNPTSGVRHPPDLG
ncbi:MAG TPA: CDF family Co(II)/Ni(II) efflux transporter DmeF [Caulobacteraceae bacterium]|nr:CDF family Co(II)/Ni(II) efflux transporter DmeF [Caulobacteraceae bacterium]